MKKTFLLVAGVSLLALASCKRKGTCTCTVFGADVTTKYEDMDKDEYDQTKSNCESAGCEWSDKL